MARESGVSGWTHGSCVPRPISRLPRSRVTRRSPPEPRFACRVTRCPVKGPALQAWLTRFRLRVAVRFVRKRVRESSLRPGPTRAWLASPGWAAEGLFRLPRRYFPSMTTPVTLLVTSESAHGHDLSAVASRTLVVGLDPLETGSATSPGRRYRHLGFVRPRRFHGVSW